MKEYKLKWDIYKLDTDNPYLLYKKKKKKIKKIKY